MREETITRTCIKWLTQHNWKIVSFDYPQSGTGVPIQRDKSRGQEKNKGSIIPDIIARKENTVLIFENKVKFSIEDLGALILLRDSGEYDLALSSLLGSPSSEMKIFVGVALENNLPNEKSCNENQAKLDFAFLVSADNQVYELQKKIVF